MKQPKYNLKLYLNNLRSIPEMGCRNNPVLLGLDRSNHNSHQTQSIMAGASPQRLFLLKKQHE